jgi:hypothetical protein
VILDALWALCRFAFTPLPSRGDALDIIILHKLGYAVQTASLAVIPQVLPDPRAAMDDIAIVVKGDNLL